MPIDTIATWHEVAKRRDIVGLDKLLADNATFHSPVVHTPQVGKKLTKLYLAGAFHVLFNETFKYVREIRAQNEAMLEFSVEIDGIEVNGVDIIRWNDEGLIEDFKVMLRPLKAINMVHQKMGAMLESMKR